MEVTLNPKGWHRKLQLFVFPDCMLYNSLCPYFWLTIFCILITFVVPIVPVIKIVRLIWALAVIITGAILKPIDKYICQPLYNSSIMGLSEEEITKDYLMYNWNHFDHENFEKMTDIQKSNFVYLKDELIDPYYTKRRRRKKMEESFLRWKSLNPNWEQKILEIQDRVKVQYELRKKVAKEEADKQEIIDRAERHKKRAKVETKKVRSQKMFTMIALYTKYPFFALMGGVLLAIAYYIWKGAAWLINKIVWSKVILVAETAGIMIVLVGIAFLIVYLIYRLATKCNIDLTKAKWLVNTCNGIVWCVTPIGKFFYYIGLGIASIFLGIFAFFKFLWFYAKSTKDSYCPHINWKNETTD